jgi:hypothetical protein
MPCRSVRQVTEIARLWVVRRGAIVSAGTVRQESDTACPSERGMASSSASLLREECGAVEVLKGGEDTMQVGPPDARVEPV